MKHWQGQRWPALAAHTLLEFIFPTRCICCDHIVDWGAPPLCKPCGEDLAPIEPPLCYRCGCSERITGRFPGGGDLCASCVSFPPVFVEARSCWSYEGPILAAWPKVKYGKQEALIRDIAALLREDLLSQLGDWVEQHGPLEVHPVPMHPAALLSRGFHAPAKLVRHVLSAPTPGVTLRQGILEKRRRTAQQAGLGRLARIQNLEGAFGARERLDDRVVVIFDDVYTTGATANEIASATLAAGAKKVLVLTMARAQR